MGIWFRTLFISTFASIALWTLLTMMLTSWSAWQSPIEWTNGMWFSIHILIGILITWIVCRLSTSSGWFSGLIATLTYLVWMTILRQFYGSNQEALAWIGLIIVMATLNILVGTILRRSKKHKKQMSKKY